MTLLVESPHSTSGGSLYLFPSLGGVSGEAGGAGEAGGGAVALAA
jgi:hypothetical protein